MERDLEIAALAAIRLGAGASLLLAPRFVAGTFAGAASSTGGDRLMVRALGIRDIVLGVGLLMGHQEGRVRPWLRVGALSDAADAVSTLAGFGDLPKGRRWLILAASSGAAAYQSQLGEQVD